MKTIYSIILFLVSLNLASQSWYKASINSVEESGYYNILLDERVVAVSGSTHFSDLRINDPMGNEVPYFVRSETPVRAINEFVSYTLQSNVAKDSVNTLIVRNEKGENLNRFSIVIESAEVDKYVSMRGSNDLKSWYVVKKTENITYFGFKEGNNEVLIVDFPQGNLSTTK